MSNRPKKIKCENSYNSFKISNNPWGSRVSMSLKSYTQECRSVEGHNISFLNVGEDNLWGPHLADDKCPLGFSRLKPAKHEISA